MKIEMAELFSKEHMNAVKLRKQVLGGKFDWEKKKTYMFLLHSKTTK